MHFQSKVLRYGGNFTILCIYILQEVLKMGQSKGLSLSHLSSHDIESKLADTLNGEVIEPMLRVWRAYRYGTRHPQCDCYVICAVNQQDYSANKGAGLRPGITKLARYVSITWQTVHLMSKHPPFIFVLPLVLLLYLCPLFSYSILYIFPHLVHPPCSWSCQHFICHLHFLCFHINSTAICV